MSTAHSLRRGRRYALNEATTAIDPVVTDWAARVVRNGGSTPSLATQLTLSAFMQGLTATGIRSKMIAVNCFISDSLASAFTPLIVGGNELWVNHNFLIGDLTINGLIGNGSNKYIDTGILATHFASDANAGATLYITNASPTATYDLGYTNNAGSDSFILVYNNNGTSASGFQTWNSTTGAVGFSWTPKPGYLSGSRTAANASALYYASSTTPHVTQATISSAGGSRTAHNLFVGCTNAFELGGPFGYTSNRYSFAAFHDGLTSLESAIFFSLIQAMRQALGGGFV